jgi:hypothetical protein
MKAVYIGNLMTAVSYLAICFVSFGFYSFGQLTKLKYPLLDLLSYIRFPFIERIENLLFGFLLFTALITIVLYVWSAVETLQRIIPKAKPNRLAAFILVAAFMVAWIPDVLGEVEQWLKYLGYAESGVAFGLPLLLIAILLFQKRGRGSV